MNGKNIAFPVILIFVSAAFLFFANQFQLPSYEGDAGGVSSKFFPSVVAIMQIVICFFIILKEYIDRNKSSERTPFLNRYSVFGIVFILGYAFSIYLLGYFLSTLISFLLYLVFFKTKNIWYYVTAVLFTCIIYYVFANVFYVALPEGLIYD